MIELYHNDMSVCAAKVRSVAAATPLPLICAGSVDSVERIETLRDLGVWAFTIGTAALDGVFAPGKPLDPKIKEYLRYILSREGQDAVQRDGKYLPLTAQVVREQLKKLD